MPGWVPAARTRCRGWWRCRRPARRRAALAATLVLPAGDGLAVAAAVGAVGPVGAGPLDLAGVGFAFAGVGGDGEHGDVSGGGVQDEGDGAGVGVAAGQGGDPGAVGRAMMSLRVPGRGAGRGRGRRRARVSARSIWSQAAPKFSRTGLQAGVPLGDAVLHQPDGLGAGRRRWPERAWMAQLVLPARGLTAPARAKPDQAAGEDR